MKIVEKEAFKIVGMEIETTVQECIEDSKLSSLWERFMARFLEVKDKVNEGTHFGACFVTGECSFKYLAAVEVTSFDNIPQGMVKAEIAASKYAVFTHKGPLSKLNETYGKLYEKDMPESGLKQKNFWFEFYREKVYEESPNVELELWIAVE